MTPNVNYLCNHPESSRTNDVHVVGGQPEILNQIRTPSAIDGIVVPIRVNYDLVVDGAPLEQPAKIAVWQVAKRVRAGTNPAFRVLSSPT